MIPWLTVNGHSPAGTSAFEIRASLGGNDSFSGFDVCDVPPLVDLSFEPLSLPHAERPTTSALAAMATLDRMGDTVADQAALFTQPDYRHFCGLQAVRLHFELASIVIHVSAGGSPNASR